MSSVRNQTTQKEFPVMFKLVRCFAENEEGATAIEYGLIAALVSVAAIAALGTLGESLVDIFETVSSSLSGAAATASSG